MFILDPGSWIFTHPGSRGQKGTGSRIRIRNTSIKSKKKRSRRKCWWQWRSSRWSCVGCSRRAGARPGSRCCTSSPGWRRWRGQGSGTPDVKFKYVTLTFLSVFLLYANCYGIPSGGCFSPSFCFRFPFTSVQDPWHFKTDPDAGIRIRI